MRVVLLGPPGAGKGTLAAGIKENFDVLHLSTGDILRAEMKSASDLGNEMKGYVESGALVPDEVITKIIASTLKNSDLELDMVQNSDYFGVVDAADGIIALGWEPFDTEAEERPIRISFHYGDTLDSVTEKLETKGLRLINDEIKYKLRK